MNKIFSFLDNKCFIWSLADPQRVSHYRQFEDRFNMTGIDMLMQLKDILQFEKQKDISFSGYGREPARKDEDGEDACRKRR